jgi:hypothetical protein
MKKLDALIRLDQFRVLLPSAYGSALSVVLEACKHGGYVHIVIEPMKRIRSTGPLSQNHRINGFIQQICNWTGEDFATVKMYCKNKALRRGYPIREIDGKPVYSRITGEPIPESEAFITVEQAAFLIEEIEQLAAELGISLVEA